MSEKVIYINITGNSIHCNLENEVNLKIDDVTGSIIGLAYIGSQAPASTP